MAQKIKVGAVSYLNTKPLIYGFEQGLMKDEVELLIDYPSNIASLLQTNQVDIGLVPVAIIPTLEEHHIVSDYCIGCDGEVASVCLFSEVPLAEISTILLDYQSRTSVALLDILIREHWKITPELRAAAADYEKNISGTTAGLVIGDRALVQRSKSKYIYDLGTAWKEMTGLPFVFAAWVSNKSLSPQFIRAFNDTISAGTRQIDVILQTVHLPEYDLKKYYNSNINFRLDGPQKEALTLFFGFLS
ncbi:MAG: menaquinone biosynthesis protein [Ferruginibacter sp.]|nr:menaquinone biosynthesis protein [Ferruginibacter sp.]